MDIAELILRRRKQCLVHRYLYYYRNDPQVSDQQYDAFERELKQLVAQYPDIAAQVEYDDMCPSRCVGSSNLWDYPRELQMVAESLRVYNMENLEWWAKVTAPPVADDAPVGDIETGRLF
jgi:NAD-dependent DNA ligase